MPPAVLFDLDGTLVDSLEDIANAVETVLAERGHAGHPLDAYRSFIGEGLQVLIRRALPETARDDETVRDCVLHARAVYAEQLVRTTRPYDGIVELLDDLSDQEVPLAVLSNKPDDFTRAIATQLFGSERFSIVRGARPDFPQKPDPSTALHIAETVGITPSSWLFLGDTLIDLQTAKAAQMTPVGVLWGFRPQELREADPEHLIDHPAALLRLIDR